MTNEEVASFVSACSATTTLENIASQLLDECLHRNSTDNMSVYIIKLWIKFILRLFSHVAFYSTVYWNKIIIFVINQLHFFFFSRLWKLSKQGFERKNFDMMTWPDKICTVITFMLKTKVFVLHLLNLLDFRICLKRCNKRRHDAYKIVKINQFGLAVDWLSSILMIDP